MTGRVAATSAAILFALAGGVGLTAQDPCLRYEPAISELTGTIKRVVFPGPPNYESVTRGDKPETCWVLYLPKKVCVDAGPEAKSDGNDAVANVTSL